MRRTRLIRWMVLVSVLFSFEQQVNAKEPGGEIMNQVVAGKNTFAVGLYAGLAGQSEENLFFSPNSVHTALAMTYLGARAGTGREMAGVLGLALPPQEVGRAFDGLIRSLNRPKCVIVAEEVNGKFREREIPAYRLAVANALWAMKDYPFKEAYQAAVRDFFDAELGVLDFVNAPEPSRKTINDWVDQKTQQKIRELLPRGTIQEDTRLVLTNAVYFMSNWAETFEKTATRDLPFTLTDGRKRTCPQMFQQGRFGYMETKDFQGLALPYKGHDLEMVLFLPKKTDGLPALERKMSIQNLNQWMDRLSAEKVRVTLPRFEFTGSADLADRLKAMGMKQAFQWPGADFSGMTGSKDLFISAVIHKAFVAVDEQGTEAAAATAVVMTLGAAPMGKKAKPKVFRADHPFLFLIRHRETGAILFMGRLMAPAP